MMNETHAEERPLSLAWFVEPTATNSRLMTARVVQECFWVSIAMLDTREAAGGSDPPPNAHGGVVRHPTEREPHFRE